MSQSAGSMWSMGQWVEVTEGSRAGQIGWIVKTSLFSEGTIVVRMLDSQWLAMAKTACFPIQGLDYETLEELADLALAMGDRVWWLSITDRLLNHPRVPRPKKSRSGSHEAPPGPA